MCKGSKKLKAELADKPKRGIKKIMFTDICKNILGELETRLPEWLTYHNSNHTRYVLEQAKNISIHENVNGRDLLLVKRAALYHDTGFLIKREDHESLSCLRAAEDLKDSEFSSSEIEKICGMISATRIPQRPQTLLEQIVADADLEYLGTQKFSSYSQKLYQELRHFDPDLSQRKWDQIQVDFLSKHSYHTTWCKENREPVKQQNLKMVRERILTYKE
jgi:uncharacterized protein